MIPPDLASRLRLVSQDLPAPVQPVQSAQKVTDVLSDLSAGQRIMAEIQSLLPNGSYRAVVAQRELTLALPFSAKAGDTLELEVVENDGKLTLAFVANRTASEAATKNNDSVATTLSKTGNLIGNLLNGVDDQGGRAKPAALNANQPLVIEFPEKASDLAPILKDSLFKSGMFYEAHQARWVEGKLSTANLLQEPQGKLSTLIPSSPNPPANAAHETTGAADIAAHAHLSVASRPDAQPQEGQRVSTGSNDNAPLPARTLEPLQAQSNSGDNPSPNSRATPVHPELTPLVQQQLNALATQTYVWQGQVWPGQNMHWEITEDDGRPRSGEEEITGKWQTSLKLDLPRLGGIEARIGLDSAGRLSLLLRTNEAESQSMLSAAGSQLEKSLQASGLQLKQFNVTHAELTG